MILSEEEKRQMIAQIIWESEKWGTERKEELLEYFTRISSGANITPKESDKFEKKDFYSGMRIITRNGNEYIIVENSILGVIGVNEKNWLNVSECKEDLTFIGSDDFTIMEIYDMPNRTEYFMHISIKGSLLWKRE